MNTMLLGGMMCPFTGGKMYHTMGGSNDILCLGVQVFLLVWIIFVPIVITARLEKIIKLLSDKK